MCLPRTISTCINQLFLEVHSILNHSLSIALNPYFISPPGITISYYRTHLWASLTQPGWFPSQRCSHFSMPDLLQAAGLQAFCIQLSLDSWMQKSLVSLLLVSPGSALSSRSTALCPSYTSALLHWRQPSPKDLVLVHLACTTTSHHCFSVSRDVLLLSKDTNHLLTFQCWAHS